jgi:hypothetical protein
MLKSCQNHQSYFGRVPGDAESDDEAYCNENSIITEVKQTLEQLAILYGDVRHATETPLTQIGVGDIVLFTGGDLFTTRGSSTRETYDKRMQHGIVIETAPASRHAYQVAFPSGSTAWVNKSALVRSTLGHVSF